VSIKERFSCIFSNTSPAEYPIKLNEELDQSLRLLAEREGCSVEKVATDMLAFALAHRFALEEYLHRWWLLTSREQQVVALLCQDYSTKQIAELLVISPETVKSHIHNALIKFNLHDKTKLRKALEGFDFSDWGGDKR